MKLRRTLSWILLLAVLAGCVGVAPLSAAANATWLTAAKGTYLPVTVAPEGTSLIAGLAATKGVTGAAWAVTGDSKNPNTGLTDGVLCPDYNVDADGYYNNTVYFDVANGAWGEVTYDLGGTYSVEQVLVNSEGWWDQRQVWVQLYVSDTLDDLYAAANLAAEVKYTARTTLSFLMKSAEAVEGRYVGFACYNPNPYTTDKAEFDANGGYNRLRLGELAVYGEKAEHVAPPPVYQTAAKGTYLPVTAAPEGTSLIAGKAALVGASRTEWVVADNSKNPNTGLTDGVLCPDYNVDAAGYYNNTVYFDVADGSWGQLTYDTGAKVRVDQVLVNSEGWWDQRQVWVKLYVSDKLATLYDDASLAAEVKGTARTTLSFLMKPAEAVEGRYVGFACYNPSAYTTDKTEFDASGGYGKLRLGELAVYGQVVGTVDDMDELDPITHLTVDNAQLIPATNLLADARLEQGALFDGEKPLAPVADGKIGGVNDTNHVVAAFAAYTKGDILTPDGVTVTKTDAVAKVAFRLQATASIEQLLVAGSADDRSEDGGLDNRHVRYYEIYVGDSLDGLFDTANRVVWYDNFTAPQLAQLHTLEQAVEGRYVGFLLTGGRWNQARISELGVYGTVTGQPDTVGANLIAGMEPVEAFQVDARGLDNKTAVDDKGNPGTSNTGTLTGENVVKAHDPLSNLTDGDINTHGGQYVTRAPSLAVTDPITLTYDTRWLVLVYHLGGESTLDELMLSCTDEYDYFIDGVQFYASMAYADLFKNESLLYTSGGEAYMADSVNEGRYLADPTTGIADRRQIYYTLTAAQRAKTYRYVAVVVTRPYGTTRLNGSPVVGWSLSRISEFAAHGALLAEEEPFNTVFSADTVIGKVTMEIDPVNYDDRTFFENIGGIRLLTGKLPATVSPHLADNWLSMDGDMLYTVQLVDKAGKVIPETGDPDKAMNGREVEITLPATADYVQSLAVLRNGKLQRLYNAYTLPGERVLKAGDLSYAIYGKDVQSNRAKATLAQASVTLAYLKSNSVATVNKLNGRAQKSSISDFAKNQTAGAADTGGRLPMWLPVVACLAAVVAVVLWRQTRRGKEAR